MHTFLGGNPVYLLSLSGLFLSAGPLCRALNCLPQIRWPVLVELTVPEEVSTQDSMSTVRAMFTFKFKRVLRHEVPHWPALYCVPYLIPRTTLRVHVGQVSPFCKHNSGPVRALPKVKQLKGRRTGIKPGPFGKLPPSPPALLLWLNRQLINLCLNGT